MLAYGYSGVDQQERLDAVHHQVDSVTARYAKSEEPIDPPVYEQPATQKDPWWLLAFGLAMLLLCGSLFRNLSAGSLGSLVAPRNFQGVACGWDATVSHLPYLYLPLDVTGSSKQPKLMTNRATCVASCPGAADVEGQGFITISEASAVRAKKNAAFVSILHSLRSPVYATQPQGVFCVPEHPDLSKQARIIFGSSQYQGGGLRALAVSFVQVVPLSFILVGFVCGGTWLLYYLTLNSPTGAIATSVLVTTISLILYGGKLIFSKSSALTGETYFFPGILCIAAGVANIVWAFNRMYYFQDAASIIPSVRQAVDSFYPKYEGTQFLLQGCAGLLLYGSLMAFSFSQSRVDERLTPLHASLEPNGGLDILPLERHFDRPQMSCGLQSIIIFIGTWWGFEVLLTFSKYASAASAVGYFTNLGDPLVTYSSIFALRRGLSEQLGILAWIAAQRAFSRICRVFLIRSIGSRYMFQDTKSGFQDFCDPVHGGVLCELVLHTRSGKHCQKEAMDRMDKSYHRPVAQLIGVASLITWCNVMLVGTLVFIITSSMCLKYGGGGIGATLSMSPFITGLVYGVLIGYFSAILMSGIDAVADGLLYYAMVKVDMQMADPKEYVVNCPTELLYLIRSREGGEAFMPSMNDGGISSSADYSEGTSDYRAAPLYH